jgi:hypothetical protein
MVLPIIFLLGMAMQPFEKDMREITMGIYQTFFAVGIFYGDKIYALLIQLLPQTLNVVRIIPMGIYVNYWIKCCNTCLYSIGI